VPYKRYDIVKVPFPFTDRQSTKTRPAIVLSDEKTFNTRIGHSVMAMITIAKHSSWPLTGVRVCNPFSNVLMLPLSLIHPKNPADGTCCPVWLKVTYNLYKVSNTNKYKHLMTNILSYESLCL